MFSATTSSRTTLLLLALASVGAGGCRRAGPPAAAAIAVRDDAGHRVRLARPAGRVVALIPSVNEILLALGAGDRIVARSDYDREPSLAKLPSVGGGLTPNVEWLAARRPDLVVAWPDERSRAVVGRLETVGVPVYAARMETLRDVDRTTLRLGRLLGLETRAAALVEDLHSDLDAVRRRAVGLAEPRVLYLIGLDPPEVAAGGTFVDELLGIAGARNVFGDLRMWPTVSLEEIVRRDPDVVVVAVWGHDADAAARLRRAPGWSALRAVRAGRVVALDPFLANRPGPRAPEVARELFAAAHGRTVWGSGSVGVWATAAGAARVNSDTTAPSGRRAGDNAGHPHTLTPPHSHTAVHR